MPTIFHRILRGEIPAEVFNESDDYLAIHDIVPKAPFHIVALPKLHLFERDLDNAIIVGGLVLFGSLCAGEAGHRAHRIVINHETNVNTVPYFHLHVLAGCAFTWPPGVEELKCPRCNSLSFELQSDKRFYRCLSSSCDHAWARDARL